MSRFSRSIAAAILAVTLAGTTVAASAADVANTAPAIASNDGPLAAGKPAGVKEARIYGETVLWVLAGAAIIGGLVVLADDNKSSSSTSTSGTSQ